MSEHKFLRHLRQDHEEQRVLGKKLVSATIPADREKLRRKFHESLYPHMVGEEASMFQFLSETQDEEDVFSHLQKLCDDQKLSELFQAYEEAEEKAK